VTADLVVAIHITYIAIVLLGFVAILIDAAAHFERAIEIARKQSAKSWELRATMSLARAIRWTSDSLIGELLPAEIRRDSSGSRGSAIRSVSNSRADSCVQYSAALLCHRVVGSWVHGSIALKCSQRT
jgi:hypothetical protein